MRIPGRGPNVAEQPPLSGSAAKLNQHDSKLPDKSNTVMQDISKQESESQGVNDLLSKGIECSTPNSVTKQGDNLQPSASSNASVAATDGTPTFDQKTSSSLLTDKDQVQQPPKSPSLKDRAKLLESQMEVSPSQSPVTQRRKNGNAPPPPVRKSSTLTRPSSQQGSPQLEDHFRKSSLPSPQVEKKNNRLDRSMSIKVQATKLQELLSGKSTQDSADTESHTTPSNSTTENVSAVANTGFQKSSTDSGSPTRRQPVKPNKVAPSPPSKPVTSSGSVPQQQEIAAAIAAMQDSSSNISPAVAQRSTNNEYRPKLELIGQKVGREEVHKTKAEESNINVDVSKEESESGDVKEEYKPRLHLIKQKVAAKWKQETLASGATDSNAPPASSESSSEPKLTLSSTLGDVSPIVIPPLVPPKPKPGMIKNITANESPPLSPQLRSEDMVELDTIINEEEPPPIPVRTPAMLEIVEKPASPKKKKANYTNVEITHEKKEPASLPPPPPPPPTAKQEEKKKKKSSNYPRTVLKKLMPDRKEQKEESQTKKQKSKDTTSPKGSPTKKANESPTKKSPTRKQPNKRIKSETVTNRPRPTSGPSHVKRPVFMNMSKRPLPEIPGQFDGEEPPEHDADDYEQFDLGQGVPCYANYESMDHGPVQLPGRAGIQRAHSFNPGDTHRTHIERANFNRLPIPPTSQRPIGTSRSCIPDYVDGYVNTDIPNQLPMRNRPLPETPSESSAQKMSSEDDRPDYDYPDLRRTIFMNPSSTRTLPSRGRNAHSPLTQSSWASSQQHQNTSLSESTSDMRDRSDSDYVPMASALTMDDSYINWETINDIRNHAGISEHGQQQQILPPRGGQGRAHITYAADDMATTYMNVPHDNTSPRRFPFQDELARMRQQLQPAQDIRPGISLNKQCTTSVTKKPSSSSVDGTSLAPSPKPKPKPRQRSATTAGALDQDIVSAQGSVHLASNTSVPEKGWQMPPVAQPPGSPQSGTDSATYQNLETRSLPSSVLSGQLRGDFGRRISESGAQTVNPGPSVAALPPRNIPRTRPPQQ